MELVTVALVEDVTHNFSIFQKKLASVSELEQKVNKHPVRNPVPPDGHPVEPATRIRVSGPMNHVAVHQSTWHSCFDVYPVSSYYLRFHFALQEMRIWFVLTGRDYATYLWSLQLLGRLKKSRTRRGPRRLSRRFL